MTMPSPEEPTRGKKKPWRAPTLEQIDYTATAVTPSAAGPGDADFLTYS